ncbi:uncharacterized protein TNCV_3463991 [Trichonephila clavipes]|nr:uncharacterized protein TNCV_3463991 [Trichonephila clavipes]
MWTTPELAPLLTTTPHQWEDASQLSTNLTCIAALHCGSLVVPGSNSCLDFVFGQRTHIRRTPETQRNVSPSEQEEDERGSMPIFAIKDLLKKWEAVRALVLEWHPNQSDVSRVGDLYNDNAINYLRENPEKERKAIDIGHVLQHPISKK